MPTLPQLLEEDIQSIEDVLNDYNEKSDATAAPPDTVGLTLFIITLLLLLKDEPTSVGTLIIVNGLASIGTL